MTDGQTERGRGGLNTPASQVHQVNLAAHLTWHVITKLGLGTNKRHADIDRVKVEVYQRVTVQV